MKTEHAQEVLTHQSTKIVVIVAVVLSLLIGVGDYISSTPSTRNVVSPTNVPTVTTAPASVNAKPRMVAFMRKGEIWVKDFTTGEERKVSKTPKVSGPMLSPNGQNVYYFEIIYAGGGFPRTKMFVNNIQGSSEKIFTKGANHHSSKLKWSSDGTYLGFVLFGNDFSQEAYIYDTTTQTEILIGRLSQGPLTNDDHLQDQYLVDGNCNNVEATYKSFCEEYVSYLRTPRTNDDTSYNRKKFSESIYTKPNYKLSRSRKLDTGLVVLEYFTGEPQNPESKWGIGGGLFVPGYDEGVTQTYTIVLDEKIDTVIAEIPLAVETDIIFQ